MKKFFLIIIAIVFVFAACSKEEENSKDLVKQNPKRKTTNYSNQQFDVLKNVAQELAKKIAEPNNAAYLHTLIDTILADGLDEELRFFDIFNNSESRIFNTCEEISKLNTAFANIKTMLNNVGLEDNNFYGESQIYWINSQEWNGSEIPVVVFITSNMDEKTDSAIGYKLVNGNLVEVMVNENYTEKNATLIINFNEHPYTKLPYFKNGEFTNSEGLTWIKRTNYTGEIPSSLKVNPWDDPSKIYKTNLFIFQTNEVQYDYWWAGGSEFVFANKFIKSWFIFSAETDQSPKALYFTRDEIDNAAGRYCNSVINSDWQSQSDNMKIKIYEEDGGSIVNVDATVDLKIAGYSLIPIAAEFKLNSWDDDVYALDLRRYSFINDCIIQYPLYNNGGDVRFLLTMEVYNRPY